MLTPYMETAIVLYLLILLSRSVKDKPRFPLFSDLSGRFEGITAESQTKKVWFENKLKCFRQPFALELTSLFEQETKQISCVKY